MNSIAYFSKYNLVYYQFYDKLTYKEIINVLDQIKSETRNWKNIKLLSDYRRPISGVLDTDGVRKMSSYVNKSFSKQYEYIRWANLTKIPKQTAAAIYFSKHISAKNIDYHHFSTLAAAWDWLAIDSTFDILPIEEQPDTINGG